MLMVVVDVGGVGVDEGGRFGCGWGGCGLWW